MTREQAIESFRSHNPSTAAFKALGIPFEYFLRLCTVTKEDAARICDGIVDHYTTGE